MKRYCHILERTRRNHALEHATMHVLAERGYRLRIAGRSDWAGFAIYGEIDSADLADAASEALRRLQNRENELAVHPRCGTNVAAAVLTTGLLGQAATLLRSRPLRALGFVFALLSGLVLARPLGTTMQRRLTTSADLSGSHIVSIRRERHGRMTYYRVAVAHPL